MATQARRRKAFGGEVGGIVVSRARIARRLRELAREIARLYAGRELVVVGGLSGAMVFVCDLIRLLPIPVRVYMVGVRSYRGKATRRGELEFYLPLEASLRADGPPGRFPRAGRRGTAGKLLRGCHVLAVDDLLDGGGTLAALLDEAAAQSPASLRSCVLFQKAPQTASPDTVLRRRRTVAPQTPRQTTPMPRLWPDFVGFRIGGEFVVGYGLDFDGRHRNLPDLRLLKGRAGGGGRAQP